MASSYITQVVVTPSAVQNTGAIFISCVVKDADGVVLTATAVVTAIITNTKNVAVTGSPVSLSAGGGKWSNHFQLTQTMAPGRYKVVIKSVYTTNQFSAPEYFDITGASGSASQGG